MQARLVIVAGANKPQSIRLRLPAVLGRGRMCTIQLPQPLVSRQHCQIEQVDGRIIVRDLGSLNGTLVDNQKITEAELRHGSLLSVGSLTFRVELDSAETRGPASPATPLTHGTLSQGTQVASVPSGAKPAVVAPTPIPPVPIVPVELTPTLSSMAEPDEGLPVEFEAADEDVDALENAADLLPPTAVLEPSPPPAPVSQSPDPLVPASATPGPVPPVPMTPGPLPPGPIPAPLPAPLATPVAMPASPPGFAPMAAPIAIPVGSLAFAPPAPMAPIASEGATPEGATPEAARDEEDDQDLASFLKSLGK